MHLRRGKAQQGRIRSVVLVNLAVLVVLFRLVVEICRREQVTFGLGHRALLPNWGRPPTVESAREPGKALAATFGVRSAGIHAPFPGRVGTLSGMERPGGSGMLADDRISAGARSLLDIHRVKLLPEQPSSPVLADLRT